MEAKAAAALIYSFSKDRHGRFLACNDAFAELAGVDSAHAIQGMHDKQMPWRDIAHAFHATDRLALRGSNLINFSETIFNKDQKLTILTSKTQLLNTKRETIGITGSFIDISGYRLIRQPEHKPICYDADKQRYYFTTTPFKGIYLTQKEYAVFKELLLGLTAKSIARHLDSSIKTIEHHIEAIRHKLQCHSKHEVISTAVMLGLSYHLL